MTPGLYRAVDASPGTAQQIRVPLLPNDLVEAFISLMPPWFRPGETKGANG